MSYANILDGFREQMNKYFVGKSDVVDNVLCCFLAGGHVLLEDVPGVGKTTLARCFASTMGLSFGRIQFTPDTMPADVTGLTIYDMKNGEFVYREGAVMKNIILADELNRTSPKTQSAL
ncbi:MAG: AAA family ATPase, partial [Lachnospiraceae bacterium]|nr:AAA family ATPase [Lachnospiraceae bacterium]